MHFMNLIMPSDFIQVLNSTRKYYTNNEYFPMYSIFTIIYLFHEQKLNPNKYYEHEINMRDFV
jgi:hypothetical protein